MTTETEQKIEKNDDQTTTTEPTQEEKDAAAGFAAGFARARGEEPKLEETTTTTGKTAEETKAPAETKGAAAPAAAPAVDPWKDVPAVVRQELEALRALPGQIRNLAGHIGGMNSKLESALATAKAAATDKGAAAPSDKQVAAAMASPEAWKKLKEDYPDWAEPLEAEFASLRTAIDKAAKGGSVDVKAIKEDVTSGVHAAINAGLDAAEERAFVRLKHPDWKSTVNSPEFKSWTLEGGPSQEAYQQMKAAERTDPAKADAMVNTWARQYPQWWADRGAAIFDERADAAIGLLDAFKTHREATKGQPSAEEKRQRSETRLARSVPAKGTGGPSVTTGISDEEAFRRGFNRARGGST